MMSGRTKKSRSNDQARQREGQQREESLWWILVERIVAYADDLGAVILSAVAVVTILGLFGWTQGSVIDPWAMLLRRWFGWGGILLPLALFACAGILVRHRQGYSWHVDWLRVISLELMLVGALGLFTVIDGMSLPRAEVGHGGGLVGWGMGIFLENLLGPILRTVILMAIVVIFGAYTFRGTLRSLKRWWMRQRQPEQLVPSASVETEVAAAVLIRTDQAPETMSRPAPRLPRAYRKNFQIKELPDEKPSRNLSRDERLPPIEIFEPGRIARVTSREINLTAGLIEKTLADFGIPVRVVDFQTGPAVTQFAVEPGFTEQMGQEGDIRRQKVRVSQISGLANDLALALATPSLRIEAPVPGRSYVGIEVPNRKPAFVHLRPIIESEPFQKISSPLTIALGRDVSGKAVAADLAAMPHLLIAGTTGSGKSVCITSIATCLTLQNTPEDLRLVMIDPKMVELIRFNGLPHLYGKVETELERIIGVLRWCMAEMDRRYRLLEEARARDLEAYNRKTRRRRDAERLPRIVVMIDELADLMMMAPDQTERILVRLAQMARATGIHLVLATQRPSTDILTGLIKANFPARISFAVASSVDSRVILDSVGAETLLGRGDMLFLSAEASAAQRLQGVIVSDQEIESLIQYWQKERAEIDEPTVEAPWEDMIARQAVLDDRDEIIEQAIDLVRERGEASASLLQRGLRIGYPRAARLMDELEELGVIGAPQKGGRTREVLIEDHDEPLSSSEFSEEME